MPTIEQAKEWYQDSDPVHDFHHVMRVYHMAEVLAEKEGADIEIVRAAALLHDAESASGDTDIRIDHHEAAAIFAGKVLAEEGWEEDRIKAVQYCILTHRFRDNRQPKTIEAKVLFDADKLDAIGAIGAARAMAYAARAGQPLFVEPSMTFHKALKTEPGEPYTAYHEYLFKLSRIKGRMQTKSGKSMAEARTEYLKGFFKQLKEEVKGQK
jgi:uncharacterized protein